MKAQIPRIRWQPTPSTSTNGRARPDRAPDGRAAYREVAQTWLRRAKPSAAMRDCFDWAFEEVMFSAAIWSSNQDPLHPKGHLHHPAGARGRRAAHPRHPLGHRQPRLDLPGDPDLGRRALRDPGPGRRAPDDRELLHALGRQHGHRGPAQRPRPGDRRRRLVRGHRRRRPGRRPPQPRAVDARRRTSSTSATSCSTGAPTTRTGSRSSASAAHRPRRPLTDDEQAERDRRVHAQVRRLQPTARRRG